MASPKAQAKKVPRNSHVALLRGLSHLWLPSQAGASPQIVLKQNFIPGEWLYIVEEARDRSEPKTLKFYMDNRESTDETMKVYLGKTPPFLVSDTDLKDVVIQRAANGLHIKLKGAVLRYRSDLYLEDGDTYTTYRVSLEQVETRPPLPSGR